MSLAVLLPEEKEQKMRRAAMTLLNFASNPSNALHFVAYQVEHSLVTSECFASLQILNPRLLYVLYYWRVQELLVQIAFTDGPCSRILLKCLALLQNAPCPTTSNTVPAAGLDSNGNTNDSAALFQAMEEWPSRDRRFRDNSRIRFSISLAVLTNIVYHDDANRYWNWTNK